MMHVARWHRYRTGRRLTRIVFIGGLSLGSILANCGGGWIFAAQSPPVAFVPLTQQVKTKVHTLTPIPLALPIGLPFTAHTSVFGTVHHWVITGTANAHSYNIAWYPRWPQADTSVIDIATTPTTLQQLETRYPPTGERGTGLWSFSGRKILHPRVAPWNVPYTRSRSQAWSVNIYPGIALGAEKVPGTMTAETLGEQRVFKIKPVADGRMYSFVWYERGWLVILNPYPLNHNRHLVAQVKALAHQVAHLPRIPRGGGTFNEQIASGGSYVSWIHGTIQYAVANSVGNRALVAFLHRLPIKLFE